ncbi:MAG TPA: hypothetical protein PLQ23_11725, partial [Dermatophilaceae bacterium]|nr:hypothetical protein [Dermatophilaceae bacterium]
LVLTTGHRSPFFFHSEGRQIERQRKAHREPRADIHPATAEAAAAPKRKPATTREPKSSGDART